MKTLALMICVCFVAGFACSKKDGDGDKKKKDDTAETKKDDGKSSDTAKAGDTPSVDPSKEPVICCEFKGVVGTSTKTMCEKSKGTVLTDKSPPCT